MTRKSSSAPLFLFLVSLEPCLAQGLPWKQPGENFPFLEAHDLALGSVRGHSRLSIAKPIVGTNEDLIIEVTFFNDGTTEEFLDPFLSPLEGSPAQIAIYDAGKNYVGNFSRWRSGGANVRAEYVRVPNGSLAGAKRSVHLYDLPPGDYYVQVIWHSRFVSRAVNLGPTKPQRPEDLFRSNPVRITISK